jgi:FAD dependent oxidoreductase TIGR03364
MTDSFDDAVVGAGILGLAHAFHLARGGRRVVVFERSSRACGASIRNFGMIWPIGQPLGPLHELAMRSREIWLELLSASGLWHDPVGSLHLAYREDEAQVLREFVDQARRAGATCELLPAEQVAARSPAVNGEGLVAGMWSPYETCVDPRQIMARLPDWLSREYGVHFEFGRVVTDYERPTLRAGGERWRAERLFVCSGAEFETLYPETHRSAGFVRCKLQMMRSQPYGSAFRLGPMLAGGLTLRHYKNFEDSPSLAAVRARVAREHPDFDRYGIHVMASQNGQGELVIGDSHEYGAEIEIFDKPEIDRLILDYLRTFLAAPELSITARWHGIYAKHPQDAYFVAHPAEGVTVINGVGGAGMTLSFGLAEKVVRASQR